MSVCVQATARFDVDSLEPFLVRVAALIAGGFGEREISQVVGTAEGLRAHADDELTFSIEHGGDPCRLRILIRKDDGDGWDLRFFAPDGLAKQIEAAIQRESEGDGA